MPFTGARDCGKCRVGGRGARFRPGLLSMSPHARRQPRPWETAPEYAEGGWWLSCQAEVEWGLAKPAGPESRLKVLVLYALLHKPPRPIETVTDHAEERWWSVCLTRKGWWPVYHKLSSEGCWWSQKHNPSQYKAGNSTGFKTPEGRGFSFAHERGPKKVKDKLKLHMTSPTQKSQNSAQGITTTKNEKAESACKSTLIS